MSAPAVLTVALTLTLAVAAARPEGGEPDMEKIFREAVALASQGKHAEALEKYEVILKVHPEATGVLYNAGLSSYLTKDFAAALRHWSKLKTLDPGDWQVRSKLVQTWQALEKFEDRDKEIAALYELRKESGNEELKKRTFYCRDQFEVGKRKVFVQEHFDLVGERAIRWWFGVYDETGEKKEYHISLGSYDATHQIMKDSGSLKEGQRGYHLDGYYEWGHATYGMFKGEPAYDEIRKRVIKIIEEKVRPASSSRTEGK